MQNTTYLLQQIGRRRHMHSAQPHTRQAKDYVGATSVLELKCTRLTRSPFFRTAWKKEYSIDRQARCSYYGAIRRIGDPTTRDGALKHRDGLLMHKYSGSSLTRAQERRVLELTIRH
jgi:hypothetical protein